MNSTFPCPKNQKPCCRPPCIKIIWLLLWTSLSKCPEVLLWLKIYPSTILVAEDANAHANSTFSNHNFYMFMGIIIYPLCIQILCLWNSMLLWANAHVSSIHPVTISVVRADPSKFLDVCCWVNIYPSTIPLPEDAMPMQILYLLLWADSHPKSMCSWGRTILCLLLEIPCWCGLMPKHFLCFSGRSAFTFHVCRFDSISISVFVGQHPPNDYICCYGIF